MITKRYLANSEYLLKHGLEELSKTIQSSVTKHLSGWSLTRLVSFEDLLRLLLSIRLSLESPSSSLSSLLLSSLLPPENQFDRDDVCWVKWFGSPLLTLCLFRIRFWGCCWEKRGIYWKASLVPLFLDSPWIVLFF